MTGAKINTPPPTASGLHSKVVGNETSVDNVDRFLEAQSSEDWIPVEYKVELIHDLSANKQGSILNPCRNLEEALNELGAAGWDLVHSDSTYIIFSRS